MILFIPDISGFTNFVKSVEVEHSKHIISELLETISSVNPLGMQLVEIEGDALFYYCERDSISKGLFLEQVKSIYIAFHHKLRQFESQRICHCGACRTATNLELKFVGHYGPSNFIEVLNSKKPFGPDVIAVHRLLKNGIGSNEYVLLTDSLADFLDGSWRELNWKKGGETYDVNHIDFVYADVRSWQEEIPDIKEVLTDHGTSKYFIEFDLEIEKEVDIVYEYLSNFELKKKWGGELDDIRYEKDRVNKIGTKHVCVIDGKDISFETIRPSMSDDSVITYGEVTGDVPLFKEVKSLNFLEANKGGTYLKVAFQFIPKTKFVSIVFPILKKRLLKKLRSPFQNLKRVLEEG